MIAHINIGSNLGDRAAHINAAIDLLGSTAGRVIAVSSPWHSGPWGYDSPNMFMNVGVNIDTDLSPTALLDTVKTAERTIDPDGRHRTAEGGYADRTIDIDIIAMGDEIRRSPDPQLPHPRMHLRPFVLGPMAQILPQWRHPLLGGISPAKLLAAMYNN